MKVTVLMGGDGNERAISLKTGGAMADALEGAGYMVERFDFRRARLGEFVAMPHDVVLFAMHGRDGEDGVMQAVCELLDAPYTGSGVQASALAIDKVRSKQMFVAAGVATPESAVATRADAECPVPLPAVVKPSKDGSSVGVALVREPAEGPPRETAPPTAMGSCWWSASSPGESSRSVCEMARCSGWLKSTHRARSSTTKRSTRAKRRPSPCRLSSPRRRRAPSRRLRSERTRRLGAAASRVST